MASAHSRSRGPQASRRVRKLVPTIICLSLAAPLLAQTPPDAGVLRQQIERETGTRLPPRGAPLKPVETAPLSLPGGVTVTVKEFRFAGNTLLASASLAPVVAPWLNRPLGLAELEEAAAAVANAYREAGWIVRTYLPRQDVTDGIVTIQIVEAAFGGARIEGSPPSRVRPDTILAFIEARQKKGEPINAAVLDRSLLLADDLPGIALSGSLAAGRNEGETDLVLKVTDEPLFAGEVSADNSGSRSTGNKRASVIGYLNSPLGLGDQLRGNVLHSEGSDYAWLDYSLPVGANGWRIGINASYLDYRLVAPEFRALHGSGDSTGFGLQANYALIRSRESNLYLSVAYADKRFHNEANNAVQSDYRIDSLALGLSGNLFDRLGGGGANSYSVTWSTGKLNQGSRDVGENPALAGHFHKLQYALSRQQAITDEQSVYLSLSGQHASRSLDSSERFYLGGATGVRAYPVNEGGGSRGELASAEWRVRLPAGLVVSPFYDHGHIANFDGGPAYSLKGYGLAVAWATPLRVGVKLTWARRIGNNPKPTATGADQDGSLHRNRFWLSVSLPF